MTSGPVVQLCLEKVQRAVRPVFSRREDDRSRLVASKWQKQFANFGGTSYLCFKPPVAKGPI